MLVKANKKLVTGIQLDTDARVLAIVTTLFGIEYWCTLLLFLKFEKELFVK